MSDLATVDSVILALYEARSHPVDRGPDWERFRSLFMPDAPLTQTDSSPNNYYVWESVNDYVAEHDGSKLRPQGVLELKISRRSDSLGDSPHVFGSYYQRFVDTGRGQISRGINSFHLSRDTGGWRILS